MHALFPNPFSSEVDQLVKAYHEIYFNERLAQAGLATYQLQLAQEEEELPVWLNPSERPLTKVEKGVYELLESPILSNRQLAAKILWSFGKRVDKEEQEKLLLAESTQAKETKVEQEGKESAMQVSSIPITFAYIPSVSLWIRFWILILCCRDENRNESRIELKAFYLIIKDRGLKSHYTQFLVDRWENGVPQMQKISRRLRFLTKRAR